LKHHRVPCSDFALQCELARLCELYTFTHGTQNDGVLNVAVQLSEFGQSLDAVSVTSTMSRELVNSHGKGAFPKVMIVAVGAIERTGGHSNGHPVGVRTPLTCRERVLGQLGKDGITPSPLMDASECGTEEIPERHIRFNAYNGIVNLVQVL